MLSPQAATECLSCPRFCDDVLRLAYAFGVTVNYTKFKFFIRFLWRYHKLKILTTVCHGSGWLITTEKISRKSFVPLLLWHVLSVRHKTSKRIRMRSETDEMIHIPQSMPRRLFDSVAAGRQWENIMSVLDYNVCKLSQLSNHWLLHQLSALLRHVSLIFYRVC